MAGDIASQIQVPSLLIFRAVDEKIGQINQNFYSGLNCEKQIKSLMGEDENKVSDDELETLAQESVNWYTKQLVEVKD